MGIPQGWPIKCLKKVLTTESRVRAAYFLDINELLTRRSLQVPNEV